MAVRFGPRNNIVSPSGILVSGRYYRMPNCNLTSSGSLTTNLLRVVPAFVPNTITVAKIGAEITVVGDAGSKLRLGIYDDNGGRPGSLVLDAGQIDGDSATVQEITDGVTVLYGGRWYWFGGVVQSVSVTQPTVRITNNIFADVPTDYGTAAPVAGSISVCWSQGSVSGALGATFIHAATGGAAPSVFIKVA